MKLINIKPTQILLLLAMVFSIAACDFGVQENFEFVPEVDDVDPFDQLTAWEFIQTQTELTEDGELNGEKLNYFIAAIKKAGFEDEYNQTTTTDRTYLLLNNNAFTGGGDIIDIVTGVDTIATGATPEETFENVDTPEELETLRTILRYHIVTSYVAQIPTLFEFNVWYLFQTLIPGDDGLIAFSRDDRLRVTINRAPAPLPSTALSQWERVRNHNYVFNNGIGHFIADPVRNQPY